MEEKTKTTRAQKVWIGVAWLLAAIAALLISVADVHWLWLAAAIAVGLLTTFVLRRTSGGPLRHLAGQQLDRVAIVDITILGLVVVGGIVALIVLGIRAALR